MVHSILELSARKPMMSLLVHMVHSFFGESETVLLLEIYSKRLGITVFQPRLKVRTFARTNYYEYGKQRQVQESP